ncbi:MAG: pyrroline-5-carboxylate reductase [Rhodoferax sp.]|nr:pyrroline-5-carboxylate reductase [Rhodoferax sp.]
MHSHIAFIGGGNMASAILQGLLQQGYARERISVVEPFADTRALLAQRFGVQAEPAAGEFLRAADLVVWAVKPQTFQEAASQVQGFTPAALHLSVAAGIPSRSIARWLGSERIVRAMPNTPALIGRGITAFFARDGVQQADRQQVEQVMHSTGETLWVETEARLDAVTAVSGSGPAYVFYFMEAMMAAGTDMGLSPAQARQLTLATFAGASELARASEDPPDVLRQRVTSKGGTTFAAITAMDAAGMRASFQRALQAACDRARTLGDEFGAG